MFRRKEKRTPKRQRQLQGKELIQIIKIIKATLVQNTFSG